MNVANLTADQFAALDINVVVGGAIVGSPPQISFALQDAKGNPIVGFGGKTTSTTAPNGYTYGNIAFTIARLVPETPNNAAGTLRSRWISYMVVSTAKDASGNLTHSLGRPGTENVGELVDNGNGTYVYKFYRDISKVAELVANTTTTGTKSDLDDLTYDPNAVHRIVIQIAGNAPGTSGSTGVPLKDVVNVVYDFIPATGKAVTASDANRDVVNVANCNVCHEKLSALGFHRGYRYETKFCVTCHTDQRKFGRADSDYTVDATTSEVKLTGSGGGASTNTYRLGAGDATTLISNGDTKAESLGNFPNMVHKIHNGTNLTKVGYNFAGLAFNEKGFSILDDGQRLCMKCHKNADKAENFNKVPSKLACGACHDGINFATGKGVRLGEIATTVGTGTNSDKYPQNGHGGGAIQNEAACAICHTSDAIKLVHQTENLTPNNPKIEAGLVTFTYEIASATVDDSNTLTIKFRILGATAPSTTKVAMTLPPTGFTGGGATFLLPFSVTQDGVTTPADWNNARPGATGYESGQPPSASVASLVAGKTPDADGYYTVTIANAYPAGAKMRAVVLQSYWTQAAGTNGIAAATARHAISTVKAVTGDAERRQVIAGAKCSNCHEWLELHGGSRVIGPETTGVIVCVACHNPNLTSGGRQTTSTQMQNFIGSVKDGVYSGNLKQRTYADVLTRPAWKDFVTALSASDPNAALKLPVTSNNFKDMIHGVHAGKTRTSPFVDARMRSNNLWVYDFSKVGFPGILSNCETCHNPGTYTAPSANTLPSTYDAFNGTLTTPADVTAARKTVPNTTDKVTSPYAAACVTCHDSAVAQSHMGGVGGVGGNGGQIGVARSALVSGAETCSLCHGTGGIVDVAKVHNK